MRKKVIDVIHSKLASCDGKMYYVCESTGQWKAVVGKVDIDDVHLICQKIISRQHQLEMNAEVAIVNLLRELKIERAPALNRNQI